MITENLSTLKIHKLTQAQYDRELEAGNLDETALYFTPDEEIDLSPYATIEQLNEKADSTHTHQISDINDLQSSLDNKVSNTTTINGKSLNANITLSASDVGADSSGSASSALESAKTYADGIKDELLNGAGTAYDTLKELGDLIDENSDAIAALETVASGKQSTITGAATTITSNNLTTNRALISNSSGKVAVSAVTSTELSYLDGVTSKIQTQLNNKASSSHTHSDYALQTDLDELSTTVSGKSDTGHTHNVATTSTSGFMSASDKTKLNGIDEGANAYSLPTASDSTLGGIKVGDGLNISNGLLSTEVGRAYSNSTGGEIFNLAENTASGNYSHAEGYGTHAEGDSSHAEGCATTASGDYSHAEGHGTQATEMYSHAEGSGTTASGYYSHAEGSVTTASGDASHAEGHYITALDYQHAQGHYNKTATALAGVSSGTSSGTAFVIGNGTESAASNAFRVTYAGKTYGIGTFGTSGADYAEFFEWQDLNPNAEDRRGYFVTLDGEKIKIAEPNDYVLGIISGMPAVIGNSDEDWRGRYILDDFGAFITEEFEYEEEVFDKETGEKITVTKIGTKYKENPDYDPTLPYVQREDRPEWDAVGMMGVLSVRDDGTCEVNGYCKVAEGGIATASENGYRVIARINENIVRVVFR